MRNLYLLFICLIASVSLSFGQNRKVISFDFESQQVQGTYNNAKTSYKGLKTNGSQKATFESQFVETELQNVAPFLSVSLKWEASGLVDLHDAELYIRTSANAQNWNDWQEVHTDAHAPIKKDTYFGKLMYFDQNTQFIQTKIVLKTGVVVFKKLDVHLYNPGETPSIQTEKNEEDIDNALKSNCPCDQPNYLSRNQWCPAGNCPPSSNPTATSPTHLIVHHSDNNNSSSDWAAVVRSIWNYHVNVNNWDDIGYNWLIDRNGVVYEGRGNGIRGAHFCGKNTGTQGNCLVGNFNNTQPSNAARTKLVELLAWQACQYNIKPIESSYHSSSGFSFNNIAGHRQGCGTECPGSSFYNQFGSLRGEVDSYIGRCGSSGGGDEDIYVTNPSVSSTNLNCGDNIKMSCTQNYSGNQLDANLPSFNVDYYLSTNTTFDNSDIRLGGDISSLGSDDPSHDESDTSLIPPDMASGTYYIIFVADADNELAEDNENNNIEYIQIQVSCNVNVPEDIFLTNVTVSSTNLNCGDNIKMSCTQNYSGNQLDANLPSFDVDYYLSTNTTFDNSDIRLGGDISSLGSDDPSHDESDTSLIPADTPPGTYYILFVADADHELSETNENNNVEDIQIQVLCNVNEDIFLTNVAASPISVNCGTQISLSCTQNYSGNQPDSNLPSFDLGYYLSNNTILDGSDILLDDDGSSLGSDDPFNNESATPFIPSNTSSGTYYVLFVADAADELAETDENNNIEYVQIQIGCNMEEDIFLTNPSVSNTNPNCGDDIALSCTQNYSGNQPDANLPSFNLDYYLSTNTVLDNADIFLTYDVSGIGSDDTSEAETGTGTIPADTSPGTYYILFVADADSELAEANENNNIEYIQIQVSCAPTTYAITVTSSPSNGGTIIGGGTYTAGSNATVTATPNSDWTFTNWTENGNVVSSNSSYQFTVTANRNLVANYLTTTPCPSDNIFFATQEDIDDFPINFPNCTEIIGDVIINDSLSTSITNLHGLNQITSIGGSFNVDFCSALDDLTGLENLTTIGGYLRIVRNPSVRSFQGLNNLSNTGGGFFVRGNPLLTNFDGMENLTHIGNRPMWVFDSDGLNDISGLSNIDYTTISNLQIYDNLKLAMCSQANICDYLNNNGTSSIYNNAPGCNDEVQITSSCNVDCPSDNIFFATQEDIDNFPINHPNCTEIIGDVIINDSLSASITNLHGLNQITSIGGSFNVDFCSALDDLTGLENLTTIGGYLRIVRNPSVRSFQGLNNLSSTGGGFFVRGNPLLTNFDGMENLTDIGNRPMWVFDSDGLNDISGLSNIDYTTISNLQIYDNLKLAMCSQTNICDYISNGGSTQVYNNRNGCNEPIQIIQFCPNNKGMFNDDITLYPNPAKDVLHITDNNGYHVQQITIYDTSGRVIYTIDNPSNNIDVSAIAQGMYIVKATLERGIFYRKIVIE